MWILDFYKRERAKRKERGENFLIKDLCKEIEYTPPYISTILSGKTIISIKMAEKLEEYTNGELKAEDLLEYSIEKHKKYLDRKDRFGDRLKSMELKRLQINYSNRIMLHQNERLT